MGSVTSGSAATSSISKPASIRKDLSASDGASGLRRRKNALRSSRLARSAPGGSATTSPVTSSPARIKVTKHKRGAKNGPHRDTLHPSTALLYASPAPKHL